MPRNQKQQKCKRIALISTSEGHRSIANAIEEKLQEIGNYKVDCIELTDNALLNIYEIFYIYFPLLNAIPYYLSKITLCNALIEKVLESRWMADVKAFLATTKPDAVICNVYFAKSATQTLAQKMGIPFINIIPNPRGLHPVEVSESAVNICFDTKHVALVKHAYPHTQAVATGWFVQSKFEQPYSKKLVREQLGLSPDAKTVLISGGSIGASSVLDILPKLLTAKQALQIIVACGRNEQLLKTVRTQFANSADSEQTHSVLGLPFTTNLHKYMQAADLCIGKAGPNTIFESIATHTPFVATTHLAGHETKNLKLILEKNIGFVACNAKTAGSYIKNILEDTQELEAKNKSIQKLARFNKDSIRKLVPVLENALLKINSGL